MSNLSDFFPGGSVSESDGEGTTPVSLNDLIDVALTSPINGEVLVYSGTVWTERKLAYDDLDVSSLPFIPSYLGDLNDVSSGTPTAGQILMFSEGVGEESSQWAAADPSLLSISINHLSDVDILDPADTNFLKYNSASSTWVNADISLDLLSDVNVSSASTGQLLTFNGTTWTAATLTLPDASRIADADNDTFVATAMTDDTVILQAGPDGGDIVLRPNTTVNANAAVLIESSSPTDDAVLSSPNHLKLEAGSGKNVFISNIAYPSTDGTAGQVLTTNGSGALSWGSAQSAASSIDDLNDVSITGITNGQTLSWVAASNEFQPTTLNLVTTFTGLSDTPASYSGQAGKSVVVNGDGTGLVFASAPVTILNDLTDVTIGATPNGNFLKNVTGTWINSTIEISDVNALSSSLTSKADAVHTHALSTLSDVNLVAPNNNDVLSWNSTASKWQSRSLAATTTFLSLTDTPSTYVGNASKLLAVNAAGTAVEFISNNFVTEAPQDSQSYVRRNAAWTLATDTGEVNTASNLGAGSGVFASKSGVDLQFKSLVAGSGVSLTSDANQITISAAGTTTFTGLTDTPANYTGSAGKIVAVNAGGTALEFITAPGASDTSRIQNTGNTAFVETEDATDGVVMQSDAAHGSIWLKPNVSSDTQAAVKISDSSGNGRLTAPSGNLAITASGTVSIKGIQYPSADGANGQVLTTNGAGVLSWSTVSAGSGEANTASNLGAGTGVFASKSGVDLQFKSLVAGSGVSLSSDANTITVNATAATPTYISDGDGNTTVSTASVADSIVLSAGPTTGDVLIKPNTSTVSTASVRIDPTSTAHDATVQSNSNLKLKVAAGKKVYISDLAYPSADGANGQVLTTNGAGVLSWSTVSSGTTTFTGLTDTPANYTGSAGKIVAVNAGATGLEFITPSGGGATAIDQLTDVDTSTAAPTDGQALVWNSTSSQWVPGTVATNTNSEYVVLRYGSGADGRLDPPDAVHQTSAGVNCIIVDGANTLVRFEFTGKPWPPTGMLLYGQQCSTNRFIMKTSANLSGSWTELPDTGTITAPNALGNWEGVITAQLDRGSLGLQSGFGQRSFAIIRFSF